MKKNILIISIFIVIFAITMFLAIRARQTISDDTLIENVIADSHLEILLNFGNYDIKSVTESALLENAMALSKEIGNTNEAEDGTEYVATTDIHNIINEMTGIEITAPIQIEDFYYVYDSENECYCLWSPAFPPRYKLVKINKVTSPSRDEFVIESLANKYQDGEEIVTSTIRTTLKLTHDCQYTNYQIISQKVF